MADGFSWVEFYAEFAEKLLEYKDQREKLVENVESIYSLSGIKMPQLEKDNKLVDIDPFTVFGLFNKSSMKESNRVIILTKIKELFQLESDVPISFDGLPVLNNLNATYYNFIGERENGDIDDLWKFFERALEYKEKKDLKSREEFAQSFDIAINKKGNANSKITMGLFWIAPDFYLNLDNRNAWYIYQSGKIPKEIIDQLPRIENPISAANYLEIVDKINQYILSENCPYKDNKELSFDAWQYSEKVNKEKKAQREFAKTGSGLADEDVHVTRYWLFSPGEDAKKWNDFYESGVMGIGWSEIGDLSQYESKEAMINAMKQKIDSTKSFKNDAYATWQFLNEISEGDIIFAKKGRKKIVGRGIVKSEYHYDDSADEYVNLRDVDWTHKGDWNNPITAPTKTLTDITSYTDDVEKIKNLFDEDDSPDESVEPEFQKYDKEKFLEEVYISEKDYDKLVKLVQNKQNVILQGAPGVGKTYIAKRLAYAMIGCKNPNRVKMVQFHQSYTYEDFIEGFRQKKDSDGFDIKKGAFYKFCKEAEQDDADYYFIIDEINRGNLSKIFGELFMLIEKDKRGNSLQLLYSDDLFTVPKNVYIIGTMNTADRSIAMLDYALRRRFSFFDIEPGFSTEGFQKYQNELNNKKFDQLIYCVNQLNDAISSDESLGEGYRIGISYFCELKDDIDGKLSDIIEYELIPLLKEYWYDDKPKVDEWITKLRRTIE